MRLGDGRVSPASGCNLDAHHVLRSRGSSNQNVGPGLEIYDSPAFVVPPDGGYGWVIVAASFLVNLVVEGINASTGTFVNAVCREFAVNEATVTLMGSMFVGFDQFGGPLASALANRYGFRKTLVGGAMLMTGAFVACHFAPSFSFLLFAFGIVGGVGAGLVYVPGSLAVNFYFTRWRASAVCLASVGINAGAGAVPHLLGYVIGQHGWRNAMLVLAAMAGCCALIGLLFKPPEVSEVVTSIPTPVSITSAVRGAHRLGRGNLAFPNVMDYVAQSSSQTTIATVNRRQSPVASNESQRGCCARCLRSFCGACCGCSDPEGVRPVYRDDIFFEGSTVRLVQNANGSWYDMKVTRMAATRDILEELSDHCVLCPAAISRTLATMLSCSLLRSLPLLFLTTSYTLASAAYYLPFIFLRQRELEKGGSDTRATMFVSAISVSAVVGRLFCACVSSLRCANHFYIVSSTQTLGACAVLVCALDPPYGAQLACAAAFGFSIACASSLRSILIVDLAGLENLTNAFGLLLLFQGVGFILGPPLAGLLKDASGSYSAVFWFGGGLGLLSALLFFPLDQLRKRGNLGDLVH